jgi:hypothetical protein
MFKCSNCASTFSVPANSCPYARHARQTAGDAKSLNIANEYINKSIEFEFDTMYIVSFEIGEEDVMEGVSASESNTIKQMEP